MQSNTTLSNHSVFEVFDSLDYGDYHVKRCAKTNLVAIIAIHSTARGPSLGGCRLAPYKNFQTALIDVLHLARGMSYKAAISKLPHGGGKAVILAPPHIPDRQAFFKSFGEFVHELGGRYITAEDSGVFVEDMDIIREVTPYVSGFTDPAYQHQDPSPVTALGVRRGIEAAVKFKLNKDSLEGIHVAVKGVGKVGYHLCQELNQKGAKLTIADINQEAIQSVLQSMPADVVDVQEIHKITCDVYAPCALSFEINQKTLPDIQAHIIAGAANNQLEHKAIGEALWERDILYAPDFAINAGGLIQVSAQYAKSSEHEARKKVEDIYQTLMEIFQKAQQQNKPTHVVANEIAQENLRENT